MKKIAFILASLIITLSLFGQETGNELDKMKSELKNKKDDTTNIRFKRKTVKIVDDNGETQIFVNKHNRKDEKIDFAARRVLNELTGIHDIYLTQVGVYDELNRYPTHRVISILYCALVKPEVLELIAGSHAKEVKWFNLSEIKQLPFDHNKMINTSLDWLKEEIWKKPVLSNLMPTKFPLNKMQELYQQILNIPIDNRNFRKKVISQDLVRKLDEKTTGGRQRPAFLYEFKQPLKKTSI